MTAIVTMKVPADSEKFVQFAQGNPDKLKEIADIAKSGGALSHRFGVGDGFIHVVDTWESGDQFMKFFSENEGVAEVMRESGATGEPEITISEAADTADQF